MNDPHTPTPRTEGMETITVLSSRFGEIEIAPESVLDFPSGLIGLGGRRYALLARSRDSAFAWLHSLDDPDLAIPVTNPWRFFERYEVELSDDEAARCGLDGEDETSVYVTVRTAESLEDFCANLRAPIVIARGRGHQVINQSPDAPIRAPLFAPAAAEASQAA